MAVAHCVITKEFTFRGKPERYSNGYNLQCGSNALTTAYVKTLCDSLRDMERLFHPSAIKFVYSVGGPIGEDATYSEEYSAPTSGLNAGAPTAHPETAYMAESKFGPKKYCRKYYHTLLATTSGGSDGAASTVVTAIQSALVKLNDGTLPGAAGYCRPNGALLTDPWKVDPYVRVHQLKRRGKRP